jgi:transcriptional regulator with XRE-family HTH domain
MRQTTVRELLKILARHIKEQRKILDLSQEMLAERAGVSSNFLARIEIADKTPSLSTIVRLANALEVPVADLLYEEAGHSGSLLDQLDEQDREFALRQFHDLVEHLHESKDPRK